MNSKNKRSRPLFLFYLLVAYVFLQFTWWTYSMFQLNNEIALLKTELNILKGESADEIAAKGNEINEKLHKKWTMISGEGAVFIGLLLLGIYRIRITFKKEQELSARQKNFLLSVTHELKSPIASTKLQLQTLEKRELPREKQVEIIRNAINDADRLNNLVENILLAARIENNIVLHRERFNISEYITQGMNQTASSFGHSERTKLDIEPDIFLDIDRTTFPSIILNLYENAVKYSAAGSEILLSLKSAGDKVILRVCDQGPGIADAEKEKIFDKFYRAGNEETRRSKGTGLGLYITRYLVEQHNGTITVRNNRPHGSIFEVTFTR